MLVLTRKRGESVMVGDVKVTIQHIMDRKVRLSFEGPREVKIVRTEAIERGAQRRSPDCSDVTASES